MFTDLQIQNFLNKLGSDSATPGGGTASAMSGAMSASLLSMVMRISLKKCKEESIVSEFESLIKKCDLLSRELAVSMDKDAEAFDRVMEAFKLPKRTQEEKDSRKSKIQIALKGAALAPLNIMEKVQEVALCGKNIVDFIPGSVASDIGVSALLAKSALEGAYYNVRINLKYIRDDSFNKEASEKAKSTFSETEKILDEVKKKIDKVVEGEK
jgi:formiminotetrahydrofolate cyclodeaminase